jgi:ribosomal protein S18 acetylase RimI-like enzyme
MTEPVIRPMSGEDIPLIAGWMTGDALWRRYGIREETIPADFREALERGDLLLIADADKPARGFAWCQLNGMFGNQAYLKRIGVDPALTGRNIGGLLLDRLEAVVRESGRNTLYLLVSDFNEGAQRFYRRRGYQQIGAFPDLAVPGVTELLFSKALGSLSYSPNDPM